jgi:DNA-binding CsgD family transcriptional regulator
MSNRSRRFALLDFTEKELRVVALRTSGVKPEEIAQIMNAKIDTTRWRLRRAMRKAGIDDIVLLTRWAIENALDLPLGPETVDERAHPGQPLPRKRVKIKLGLIKRMKLTLLGGKMPVWKANAEAVAVLSRKLGMKIPLSDRKAGSV